MFFKKIETWSRWKLRFANLGFLALYYGLVLIGPIIIICSKWKVFSKYENTTRLNGLGIVIALVVFVCIYRILKKQIAKLPDAELTQQKVKYSLQFILDAAPLIIIAIFLFACKDQLKLVYITFEWCMWYFVGGKLVDYFALKYIDREFDLRHKAQEYAQIKLREGK